MSQEIPPEIQNDSTNVSQSRALIDSLELEQGGGGEEPEPADRDPLHIGNLVDIESATFGHTIGRIVYRDVALVRVMPQETSDRAIDFPMIADGTNFVPDIGVTSIQIIEEQPSDYYVDVLGARPGETLEFFTIDGKEAAPSGIIAEVIKTASKDTIKLTDGRTLKFRGIGPTLPIAVVRVRTDIVDAAVAEQQQQQAEASPYVDIFDLLNTVMPAATVEHVPAAERTYPDAMQREDMYQDLLEEITAKQRTNPRRIRFIEREVELAISLKNKSILRTDAGTILGPAPYLIISLNDAVKASKTPLPAAIPIVNAALNLNLDVINTADTHNEHDVHPRELASLLQTSEDLAQRYIDGALPDELGSGFFAYMYDLHSRDGSTLRSTAPAGDDEPWKADQDVLRTAGLGTFVQGLSHGLPPEPEPISLAYLISNVTNRSVRALTADSHMYRKTGDTHAVAPADPFSLAGYVMLPPKAAITLRPPVRTGHLPTALLYSAALENDNLPTIAQTLRDLYTPDAGSPQHAWTLTAEIDVAVWLQSVLRYTVHPIDSLGPRSPRLLSLLDTLGLGITDMSPAVAELLWAWVAESQQTWRTLLVDYRKKVQALLDTEQARTFQSVTGIDAPIWAALRGSAPLQELLEDIRRRNPTIADAPTLMTASLLLEAQGDAAPLVWSEIITMDGRQQSTDTQNQAAALAASRAYILKRKALRDRHLLALSAEPEINTCPHAMRLEAIRNVTDVLQRSRLLRDFILEFQGPVVSGSWMSCVLCNQNCVCNHELLELEALAQPSRMEAIQKQILIKFGGERYEGKIVCRNCGQSLQEIDYDEHVEFDDQGRPISNSSVLTAEQIEEPTETAWTKATADLAPPVVVFASASQREIGDALQLMCDRGGLQIHPDVIRQIVRQTDLYVSARAPPAAVYEKQRARLLTSAGTKIAKSTGVSVGTASVPTYTEVLDQLRVSALTALTAIAIQCAEPAVTIKNPFPLCPFSREGYPYDPTAKPEDPGALLYMACVVASIQRNTTPWKSLTWAGEPKLDPRRKKVLQVAMIATQIILGADPKSAPLSFTPEIRQALSKAQTDVAAIKMKAMKSLADQLPVGFRPEPSPPAMSQPALERDPIPAIEAALRSGTSVAALSGSVSDALRQQNIAIVGELHAAAAAHQGIDGVCCPESLQSMNESHATKPLTLVNALTMLRRAIPTGSNTGTHVWPVNEPSIPIPVVQVVDEGILFKLFLKYCYTGAQVGESHEFSTGDACRQCGLMLGKPFDLIDFSKEGAGILAAQQGDLRIEITQSAFNALSDTVRRRRILQAPVVVERPSWFAGLQVVMAASSPVFANTLGATLATVASHPADKPLSDIGRATLWLQFATYMEELRSEVEGRMGASRGLSTKSRTQTQSIEAISLFDTLTEDPFIEGPRALQEYWCAKVQAAATGFSVTKVTGAVWSSLSRQHNDMMNKLVSDNALWYGGEIHPAMKPVLLELAKSVSPLLQTWIRVMRPMTTSAWTVVEAQMVLRTIVLQGWRDALDPSSPMYESIVSPAERDATASRIVAWSKSLLFHVKQQFIRYSKETIKRILQDRAGLERDTIVEEFESIKDNDVRAAELLKKQFRIGRWGQGGKNLQKYDADTFEFENEQRKRMGIVDQPVDPILLEGGGAPVANDYGFGDAPAGPEDGYDVGQGAEGDDY